MSQEVETNSTGRGQKVLIMGVMKEICMLIFKICMLLIRKVTIQFCTEIRTNY